MNLFALGGYLVIGLAAGAVFALSGVGVVVLYRTTGVVFLAAGAVQAVAAFIAWSVINDLSLPVGVAAGAGVVSGALVTLVYGAVLGPVFASRAPVVKATASLGYLLILMGVMSVLWPAQTYVLSLPTSDWSGPVGGVYVNVTQVLALVLGVVVTALTGVFLRRTRLGIVMRALADSHEGVALLGVPVQRVEGVAWFGCGVFFGAGGVLLAALVGLDITGLTFLVLSGLAAALVGRLESLWLTLVAGLAIGVVQSTLSMVLVLAPYRAVTPFVVAVVAMISLTLRQGRVTSPP